MLSLKKRGIRIATAVLVAGSIMLSACSGGGGGGKVSDYDDYAAAYGRVRANSGMDADLTATITMDGETTDATGNFKMDDSGEKTLLYLQMDVDGETMTQFSDGTYLYTDSRGKKTKYPLGEKQTDSAQGGAQGGSEDGSKPEFEVSSFLKEFASFIEAGKIKEMGILSAIPKEGVNNATKDGDTYTLEINDQVLQIYLDQLSSSVTGSGDGDSIKVSDLKDFVYTATVKDDCISDVSYKGKLKVTVPASLMSDGNEKEYDLDFTIAAAFNNPGEKVEIDLPDTDGYSEE